MAQSDDTKTNSQRRHIVRNAAIVFLLVMLLLTFFSKTIQNFLLPEVECINPVKGYLQKEIQVPGEVRALDTKKIFARGSWDVLEVSVKEGDSVSKGAILARVDTKNSALEIKRMETELLHLRNDLQSLKESYKPFDEAPFIDDINEAGRMVKNEQAKLDIILNLYNDQVQTQLITAGKALEAAYLDCENKKSILEQKKKEAIDANDQYNRQLDEKGLAYSIKYQEIENFKKNPPNMPSEDLALQLKRMELELLQLQNDLQSFKTSYVPVDIKPYEEDVRKAELAVNEASQNLRKVIETYEQNSDARLQLMSAEESLQRAKLDYSKKQASLLTQRNDAAVAENTYKRTLQDRAADIELKAEELRNLQEGIPDNGLIIAPFDGIVKSVGLEEGQTLSTQQPIFELMDSKAVLAIQWSLNPEKAELLKTGDTVYCKIKGDNSQEIKGTVGEREFKANEGLYLYTADIPVKGTILQEGMEVEISARKTSIEYPIIVPNSSISKQAGQNYVFVLKERNGALGRENYVEAVSVAVKEYDDFNSAVSGYINPEDNIVTLSSKPLFNKAQVKLR